MAFHRGCQEELQSAKKETHFRSSRLWAIVFFLIVGLSLAFAIQAGDCPVCDICNELKIDPPGDGEFRDDVLGPDNEKIGPLIVQIVGTYAGGDMISFDWTSNVGVDSVYVKSAAGGAGGESESRWYDYDPEATSGTGLTTNTGQHGISHITFCYDVEPVLLSITGTKFNDLNGNGVQDAGEAGLVGWTINLGGDATDSTTTGQDGLLLVRQPHARQLHGGRDAARRLGSDRSGWWDVSCHPLE